MKTMMIDTNTKIIENAFAVHIFDDNFDTEYQKTELKNLIESATANYLGNIVIKLRTITPATYIGSGKLQEIKQIIEDNGANIVVFDGVLSPSQTINMSNLLDVKVVDRTTLILDIFAKHALTREGKIQVELAQLNYLYPRLKGKGSELSRLGGGIGTRGPGETKLESDRRHIRTRIDNLKNALSEIETRRELVEKHREKSNEIRISLVGYTNVGKSSILNTLSGSNVLAENKLFATLDATTRKVLVKDKEVLFTDTVGFIRNIPTSLIEAFKSTLESAKYSDINIIVASCDGDFSTEIDVTTKTLQDIGAKGKQLLVLNKCDTVSNFDIYPKDAIFISAKTGQGIDYLLEKINELLNDDFVSVKLKVEYKDFNEFNKLKNYLEKCTFTYTDDFVICEIVVKKIYSKVFSKYKKIH